MGTDRGAKRRGNEDAVLADGRLRVVAVLDGMGRFADASLAVTTAGDALMDYLGATSASDDSTRLRSALYAAGTRIRATGKEDPRWDGAVVAVAAVLFGSEGATIAHAGDCRAYLWRAGMLTALTADHDLERHMRELGRPADEIEHARVTFKKVLTQALGAETALNPEISFCALQPRDRLILMTDGAYDVLGEAESARRFQGDPLSAVDSILADVAANGADNAALAIIEVLMDGAA